MNFLDTKGKYGKQKSNDQFISKFVMIGIFVEFNDQLIDYPINCASLSKIPLSGPLFRPSKSGLISRILLILNTGIKHGFSCIYIRQVPREVLKTEPGGRGFQHPLGTWRMLMH